jgi:hypothetical protein
LVIVVQCFFYSFPFSEGAFGVLGFGLGCQHAPAFPAYPVQVSVAAPAYLVPCVEIRLVLDVADNVEEPVGPSLPNKPYVEEKVLHRFIYPIRIRNAFGFNGGDVEEIETNLKEFTDDIEFECNAWARRHYAVDSDGEIEAIRKNISIIVCFQIIMVELSKIR